MPRFSLPMATAALFNLLPLTNLSGEGFSIDSVRAGIKLEWDARPGYDYIIWWSPSLDPPVWERAGNVFSRTSGTMWYFDPQGNVPQGYYRLEQSKPMILVPGSDGGGVDYDFYVGKYEVTNAEFARFLDSSPMNGVDYRHVRSRMSYIYTDKSGGRVFPMTGQEDHPVVYVSWSAVLAYCNWLSEQDDLEKVYDEQAGWQPDITKNGYRLPTESEWYKAACWDPTKGGTGGFWRYACRSDEMRGSLANYADSGDPYEAIRPGDSGSPPYQTTPVGFYNGSEYRIYLSSAAARLSFQTEDATSYYGCYDMSGNAEEFVMVDIEGSFSAHQMGIHWRYSDPTRWDFSRYEPISGSEGTLGFRIARSAP